MFPSFYIYNENNFQAIIDIENKSSLVDDESSIDSDYDIKNMSGLVEDESSIDSNDFDNDDTFSGEEDDLSIDSDFLTHDSIDEQDLESIYSFITDEDSHDFEDTEDSSIDSNDSIETDNESIVSHPLYVSSGISIDILNPNFYVSGDKSDDDEEPAIIIEIDRHSRNYTDKFIRRIYKKKTDNYKTVIAVSIAMCTLAIILNWSC
jgi:hypothetical protein